MGRVRATGATEAMVARWGTSGRGWAAVLAVMIAWVAGPALGQAPAREPAPDLLAPLAHVEERGEGPVTLVLVPGIGCDWTVWRTFMERNSARYRMLAVTLPGFGAGTLPEGERPDFTERPLLQNALRALDRLIDERKLDRPVIVGHSLGGHLALWFGARHAERTRGVVSIEGFPLVPLADPRETMPLNDRHDLIRDRVIPSYKDESNVAWRARQAQLARTMVVDEARATELATMISTPARQTVLDYQVEYLGSDLLGELRRSPTRGLLVGAVVRGMAMPEPTIREMWRAMAADLPTTTLALVEGSRHFVMDDAPEALDAIIESFVSGRAVPGEQVYEAARVDDGAQESPAEIQPQAPGGP